MSIDSYLTLSIYKLGFLLFRLFFFFLDTLCLLSIGIERKESYSLCEPI